MDPYTSENIYSLEKTTTNSVTDMMHTLSWQTLQEHRIKARLQMFHKIVNNKIEIPHKYIPI
jgi:predicted oxidoreductase (fatty acid repression mutant protein)